MAEPTPPFPRSGWIEVIVGSMYSGKTEELIRRLRRALIARQRVEIFKPAIDDRYALDAIVSHSELRIPSRSVRSAKEILRHAHEADVIGIDEGQFLGRDLVTVCEQLARQGKRVIVAGLDQDYRGRPFEPMPELLAIAEYITKTLAICMVCGEPANRTYRKTKRGGRVVVGGSDLYEARCRRCFELGPRARYAAPAAPSRGTHAPVRSRPRGNASARRNGSVRSVGSGRLRRASRGRARRRRPAARRVRPVRA
jgi:thymidine kinase